MKYLSETERVAKLAGLFALECGIASERARNIRIAALLHDIGKQRIPESILEKPGRLTPEEFEIIKTHTKLGAEMLAGVQGELGCMIYNTCLYHHEMSNGKGYWGKRLGELPDYVQIVAITDVYVALTSERVYKEAWPPERALIYLQKQAGKRFDPEPVRKFIKLNARLLRDSGYLLSKQ